MPNWASLFGREPEGKGETDGPEAEVTELLEFYHRITDDSGEIVLPADPVGASADYVKTCEDFGATWLLTTHVGAVYSDSDRPPDMAGYSVTERINQGPQHERG